MNGPLKDISEAAAWLRVHPKTLEKWVAGQLVPFTTLAGTGRLVRFADEHLTAIVAMGEQLPAGVRSPLALVPQLGDQGPPAGPSTPPPPPGPKPDTGRKGQAA